MRRIVDVPIDSIEQEMDVKMDNGKIVFITNLKTIKAEEKEKDNGKTHS